MQQVDIPGGIAVLRDKVNVAGRQALERTLPAAMKALRKSRQLAEETGTELNEETPPDRVPLTEAEYEALQRFQAAAVLAFLKHWSIDEQVPRTMDEVLDMDPDVYSPIAKAVSPLALKAIQRPSTNPDSGMKDGQPDPDSPTGPSTGSEPSGRAEQSNGTGPSTESSPSDTTSTATESSSAA